MNTKDDTIRSMQREYYQRGIVSIMVTMIMIIVITLIVLGFATVSRNEQRSTADNQLSAQAYYAAESGVNDARAAIDGFVSRGQKIPAKTSCADDTINYPSLASGKTIDAAYNVAYSCVLISTDNASLVNTLGYASTTIPLNSDSGAFRTITLQWTSGKSNPTSTAGCDAVIAQWPTAWGCNYPVIRIDMVNTGSSGTLNRDEWADNTATLFLVPEAAGGRPIANFTPGTGKVQIVPVSCGSNGPCSIDIEPLQGFDSSQYYLRASTLYVNNTQFTVSSKTPGQKFIGAQAQIDVTGKAQDILRRILVAVNLTNTPPVPDYAIMSQDSVCKRYQITSSMFSTPSDAAMQNPQGADGDLLCGVSP